MITIFHGDHLVNSRGALQEKIDQNSLSGTTILRLDAKNLSEAELEEAVGSQQLFDSHKLIIIEELHSLPKSNRKNQLIEMVAAAADQDTPELVLWEKRSLTKTMLKKFSGAKEQEFKLSKSLFNWLDKLGDEQQSKKLKLLGEAIQTDGEYFCFLMLIRQLRLLIQVKSGGEISGPPFMKSKLRRQAELFSMDDLLANYKKLLDIDLAQKTSAGALSLSQELDILSINM